MPQNFIACDRGQAFLMPPSLADWVSEDHLVWTVLGAVDQMDLSAFYGAYRSNGQGRAAYDPAMMVALLIYAYSRGNRSSRGIERECREDVVYKLITALRVPRSLDRCGVPPPARDRARRGVHAGARSVP